MATAFTPTRFDDVDCDDNGAADVVFVAISAAEPQGERMIANETAGGVYQARVPVSAISDATGVLFVAPPPLTLPLTYAYYSGPYLGPAAPSVSALVQATVRYEDRWDGSASGQRCRNNSDAASQGFIAAITNIALVAGHVNLVSYRIVDLTGDSDGFPDTNETVDVYFTVANRSPLPLTNVIVWLKSDDPKIDCVTTPLAIIPYLDPKGGALAIRETPSALRFHVSASADRGGTAPPAGCASGSCSNGAGACTTAAQCQKSHLDDYLARLTVTLGADQLDSALTAHTASIVLDLNVTHSVGSTVTYVEGFESGLGTLILQNLDSGIASNALSNGMRCQYNDPDYPNSNSYGDTDCYLGFQAGQPVTNDWHPHSTAAVDGGRAYAGSQSLHYGVHIPPGPTRDTLRLSQLDAVRNAAALNLAARVCRDDPSPNPRACSQAADCVAVGGGPCGTARPELSFKHQINILYYRNPGLSLNRAVVGAQIAGTTQWRKLYPYVNVYDSQGDDTYSNCTFDPIDDGNTESDYFEPADPQRRYGPSSTCYPEFNFTALGNTDEPFNSARLGFATDGPGLPGSLGVGTWVESKFDLTGFRGRSVRIRFLVTTMKVSDVSTWEALFMWNPNESDDGWYVDDVRITQTLGAALPTASTDAAANGALPGCPLMPCSILVPGLTIAPPSGSILGRSAILSALASSADSCTDGALLFRFYEDRDRSGTFSLGDEELRAVFHSTAVPDLAVRDVALRRHGEMFRGWRCCLSWIGRDRRFHPHLPTADTTRRQQLVDAGALGRHHEAYPSARGRGCGSGPRRPRAAPIQRQLRDERPGVPCQRRPGARANGPGSTGRRQRLFLSVARPGAVQRQPQLQHLQRARKPKPPRQARRGNRQLPSVTSPFRETSTPR